MTTYYYIYMPGKETPALVFSARNRQEADFTARTLLGGPGWSWDYRVVRA